MPIYNQYKTAYKKYCKNKKKYKKILLKNVKIRFNKK